MNKTAYKAYINEIIKYPLLSAQEERSLSKRIQEGDNQAKQILINSNLRYVVSIAHKYTKNEDTLMDCIQEGSLGLMVAASKYDYRFNTRFCTYANSWITQYILRHKNLVEPSIHIPALKLEKLRVIRSARNTLEQMLGKLPTDQELAIYIGMDESDLRELSTYDYTICSIDSKIDSDTETSILHFLFDERVNLESDFVLESEREEFMSLISKLPEKERKVMIFRYNSYISGNKTSYRKMGSVLGVSIEATRQIEIRAKRKLQTIFKSHFKEHYNEQITV